MRPKENSKSDNPPVGILGSGSFGTAIALLIAENTDVLLYTRSPERAAAINYERHHLGVSLSSRIHATSDLEGVARECRLLFPIVPSVHFRQLIQQVAPYLKPYHMLIHGTKGFDLTGVDENVLEAGPIRRANVHSMSEVISQETSVVRVGCLSGPNLAKEILEGQPTATVIASHFNEVIKLGRKALQSQLFHVFGSHELLGAELAGALKNAFAIGSGILSGLGLGKNIQAMLITRGLTEMVYFGKAMGASSRAFVGTAGIGDLVATATSNKSRNFSLGYRLGRGETLEDIMQSMEELAEGVRTIKIMRQLSKHYDLRVPITEMLYKVVFDRFDPMEALEFLIEYPYAVDVDFL